MSRLPTLVAVGLAGMASACATAMEPPAPAALTWSGGGCAARADLSTALSLTPEEERAVYSVNAPVTAGSSCLQRDGQAVPYVLFALPEDYADKTVAAGGTLEALRILSPDVSVLDAQGEVTRTFAPEDYMYRGALFSVQFRPRADERYVLVAAEPSRVGQRYDSITVGVTTTQVYTAYGSASFRNGTDMAQSRTFSYEGTASVLVNDSDTREEQE